MMIWQRKCKRCKRMFDIDTSKELCPECRDRNFKINGVEGDGQRKL